MRPLGREEKVLVNTRLLDDHTENNAQPSVMFVANAPGGAPLMQGSRGRVGGVGHTVSCRPLRLFQLASDPL